MGMLGGPTGVTTAGTVAKADRDRVHLALLLVAGWVIGLAIALVLGLLEPAGPASPAGQHGRDAELAGRRWSGPALQAGPAPVLQLAGRRWATPAQPPEASASLVALLAAAAPQGALS
jgi:hypothetical protein